MQNEQLTSIILNLSGWMKSNQIKQVMCSHLHNCNPLQNGATVKKNVLSQQRSDHIYGTENKKLILEVHDFLADTAYGNEGVKSYIKKMEKYDGESRLYEINFPGYPSIIRVRVTEFYPILRKRRYKNLLKGISFLANSKLGQYLSQG